jgi:CRP/FNR family cyclic AMP-dependent transcriptional regulator
VGGGRRVFNFQKNQQIFRQGDAADSVFYIQEGQVKLSVVSELGKEAVVALQGKNEFFGEGCLSGQILRLATAAAITDCVIMRLDKGAIVSVLHEEPKFSAMFLAYILARNLRVEADLVDQLFNSSEKRLARLLLLMANFGKDQRPEPVIAKLSQETLAEMVGTTRLLPPRRRLHDAGGFPPARCEAGHRGDRDGEARLGRKNSVLRSSVR